MKDFLTGTALMMDLVIIAVVALVLYVNIVITPLTIDTITSGEALRNIGIFVQGYFPDVSGAQPFFEGMKKVIAVVTVLLTAGIFWLSFRTKEIHHKEEKKYEPIDVEEIEAKEKMVQWQVVLNHANAENPAEWKLAILEADNMLDEILESEGYRGDSIGEKLKAMDPTDLLSYSDAWEAHKVRNQIAHEGAATMDFSKKTARDTIGKFEKVFRELGYI